MKYTENLTTNKANWRIKFKYEEKIYLRPMN